METHFCASISLPSSNGQGQATPLLVSLSKAQGYLSTAAPPPHLTVSTRERLGVDYRLAGLAAGYDEGGVRLNVRAQPHRRTGGKES